MDYKQVISDIRASRINNVYLLSGEESYYLDSVADLIRERAVAKEDADFNVDIFYGADADVMDVVAAARQYPSFAPRRLVMLKEAQAMRSKDQLNHFIPYLKHPSPGTVLVIVYKGETLSATSKISKAVAGTGGVVMTSPKIRDYQLPGLIAGYCKETGIDIKDKSINILAEHIGADLSRLFSEIEKLRKGVPAGERLVITPELIERNIGISKDFNNFELLSAIYLRNFNKAMLIAVNFGKNIKDNPPMVTATVLFQGFSRLLRAHYSRDKSPAALRSKFGLRGSSMQQEFEAGMRNYSAGRCFRIIRELRRFDLATKGSGSAQPTDQLLKELIYKIFTL